MWKPGPDGTMTARRRGNPPPCPEGYEIVPGRKFVVRLTVPVCKYREVKENPNICCGSNYNYCTLFGKLVLRRNCHGCDAAC